MACGRTQAFYKQCKALEGRSFPHSRPAAVMNNPSARRRFCPKAEAAVQKNTGRRPKNTNQNESPSLLILAQSMNGTGHAHSPGSSSHRPLGLAPGRPLCVIEGRALGNKRAQGKVGIMLEWRGRAFSSSHLAPNNGSVPGTSCAISPCRACRFGRPGAVVRARRRPVCTSPHGHAGMCYVNALSMRVND